MRFLGPTWQPRHFIALRMGQDEHWLFYFSDSSGETKLRGIAPLQRYMCVYR